MHLCIVLPLDKGVEKDVEFNLRLELLTSGMLFLDQEVFTTATHAL